MPIYVKPSVSFNGTSGHIDIMVVSAPVPHCIKLARMSRPLARWLFFLLVMNFNACRCQGAKGTLPKPPEDVVVVVPFDPSIAVGKMTASLGGTQWVRQTIDATLQYLCDALNACCAVV